MSRYILNVSESIDFGDIVAIDNRLVKLKIMDGSKVKGTKVAVVVKTQPAIKIQGFGLPIADILVSGGFKLLRMRGVYRDDMRHVEYVRFFRNNGRMYVYDDGRIVFNPENHYLTFQYIGDGLLKFFDVEMDEVDYILSLHSIDDRDLDIHDESLVKYRFIKVGNDVYVVAFYTAGNSRKNELENY